VIVVSGAQIFFWIPSHRSFSFVSGEECDDP
jgi:hypothetical protein